MWSVLPLAAAVSLADHQTLHNASVVLPTRNQTCHRCTKYITTKILQRMKLIVILTDNMYTVVTHTHTHICTHTRTHVHANTHTHTACGHLYKLLQCQEYIPQSIIINAPISLQLTSHTENYILARTNAGLTGKDVGFLQCQSVDQ